jgi:chromosome segregation ATPase
MSKLKITREEVEEEAKKLNYEIDPIHFEYTEEPKRGRPKSEKKVKDANATSSGKKGRPKKMNKEVELTSDVGEDIFASLVENANATQVVNIVVSEVPTKVDTPEKSEKEAEKDAKKAEKDAKKAENDAKKAEKEAKKVENEAKKAEKEAKKVENEAKKAEKDAKKAEKKPEEEVDVVRKFEFEGTTYLKSKSTGVIYNMDQDLVGKWNEETQKIDFEDIDDEEEEDEYDE